MHDIGDSATLLDTTPPRGNHHMARGIQVYRSDGSYARACNIAGDVAPPDSVLERPAPVKEEPAAAPAPDPDWCERCLEQPCSCEPDEAAPLPPCRWCNGSGKSPYMWREDGSCPYCLGAKVLAAEHQPQPSPAEQEASLRAELAELQTRVTEAVAKIDWACKNGGHWMLPPEIAAVRAILTGDGSALNLKDEP